MLLTVAEIEALRRYAHNRPYLQADCEILLDRTGRFGETTRAVARSYVARAIAGERRRWVAELG
jgi:hypothetical protein